MFRSKGTRHEYRLTVVSASGLPDGEPVSVRWKRGSKGGNSGATARRLALAGRVAWDESATLSCTLFPSSIPGVCDPKIVVFTLLSGEKERKLGKASLDLAEFAMAGGAQVARALVVRPAKRDKGAEQLPATLVVAVSSTLVATDVSSKESSTEQDLSSATDPFSPGSSSTGSHTSASSKGSGKSRRWRLGRSSRKEGEGAQRVDARVLFSVLAASLDGEVLASGMPRTAQVIAEHIGDPESPDADAVEAVACTLGVARLAHAWSFPAVMRWLSTAWWLVREVTPKLPPKIPVKEPQYVTEPPAGDARGSSEQLRKMLLQFQYDYFQIALERAYRDLRVVLPECANARVHARVDVASVLGEARKAMEAAGVSDPLRRQYFTQIARFINATLMNLFMTNPRYCTCKTGMNVRMELSQAEHAMGVHTDPVVQPASIKLEQAREVANLLVIDKSVLLDETTTKSTFPELNWSQIYRLISTFKPDESVQPDVLQVVAAQARMAPSPTHNSEDPTTLEIPAK
eukprot:m51a1_g1075 hypothetical protein (517) ;mRNA; r:3666-5668